MWTIEDAVNNVTNTVVMPADGTITISKPDTVRVNAYVNDSDTPIQQVQVKTGDSVYFKLTNYDKGETPIGIDYGDQKAIIMLPGKTMQMPVTKVVAVEGEPLAIISTTPVVEEVKKPKKSKKVAPIIEQTTEEEIMTPQDTINLFSNPGMGSGGAMGGAIGGGLGAGLVGGLLGTALFGRNGLNGLNGDGAGVMGAALRNPPEQNQANMDLMAGIGAVDKSVAVSTATMEASQATQTLGITSQLNNVASSLAARTDNLKDIVNANSVALMQGQNAINQNIMENRYELSKDISNDGEKTRALITQQYEINLQRQLADANAAIIELRSDGRLSERTRGIEVTTTNNINQMQQQQQQQTQYGQLANMIWALGQNIRNDNAAINVGSGTQTSTPTNTNTNIR
jgi:predicted  nucleic acid-binding Zn-ribbon protein